jgi:hypothetical protein
MLQDIFGALTSGASQGNAQPQAGGDALSGLLGSLMGGGQATGQPQAGGDELSGLMGSLLGGQSGAAAPTTGSGNPLLDLVGSGQNPMVNMLIQPIVDQIARKAGIPPEIAMTVVTFAIHYMLSKHGNKLANGEDMSGLLQQHTDTSHLQTTGLSKELAAQTGMKPAAAASALSEVFKLLGSASPSN